MGRLSSKGKIERFDDDIIMQAVKLDEESKASQYLLILKDAYNGKFVKISDPVLAYAFSLQEEKIKEYLKNKDKISKQNSGKGKKGMEKRWANPKATTMFESEQQVEATAQPSDSIPYVKIVETYPFETFWKIYGKNVAHDKCQELWMRLSDDDTKAKIMDHVVKYVESRPDKRYRKDPYKYLIEKTWKDEIITNNQSASSYGSNNKQSYKEAEFERNARTVIENLQAAERGELAYLSPFNPPSGQR